MFRPFLSTNTTTVTLGSRFMKKRCYHSDNQPTAGIYSHPKTGYETDGEKLWNSQEHTRNQPRWTTFHSTRY